MGRVGIPIEDERVLSTFNSVTQRITEYFDTARVALRAKGLTTLRELESMMDDLRGALFVAFPKELPSHDVLYRVLMDNEAFSSPQTRDVETSQLWFAAKKLKRADRLSDYIGHNEKSKIVVRLSKKSANMPMREPTVDEESRKKMMAFWHRKQQQNEKLSADDEDAYLQSEWADPNALKRSFLGTNKDLRYK